MPIISQDFHIALPCLSASFRLLGNSRYNEGSVPQAIRFNLPEKDSCEAAKQVKMTSFGLGLII